MMDDSIYEIDKNVVRRSFNRSAVSYDGAAVLQLEVGRRMLQRLDYVKLEPHTILDAGSGTGSLTNELQARYDEADLVSLDIAIQMLYCARAKHPWWRKMWPFKSGSLSMYLCADIENIPLKSSSVNMIWSNLSLQWVTDLPRMFGDFYRILQPGGLLMFSTFGPDTLKELRQSYDDIDGHVHVNRFIDMHDLGDMLVHAEFAGPVMDMEYITLTFSEVKDLMQDLKAIGAHNALRGRGHGLAGKKTFATVLANYEKFRSEGKLPATFEVIYGHAWRPEIEKHAKESIIHFYPHKKN